MTDTAVVPERAARLIHILFVIQIVSISAMEMSGPFWPIHLKALSSSGLESGFAGVAVYVGPMIGIMLTSAFWGRVGDRTGRKLMMIRALLGLSLTQLGLAWADNVWTILVLRFIQGTCAGYTAPAQAYGVSIESPLRRARLFAYLQVSTNVGSLVGAVAGGLILDHATFFWINIVAAALCACCAVAVALILPNVPVSKPVRTLDTSPDAAARVSPLAAWRSSPVVGLLGVVGILLVSRMITQTPFSLYVTSVFGAGNWAVGLGYGMLSSGVVVSASLWARYFENRSLREVLRRMTFIALACLGLTLAAGLTRYVGVFITIYFAWGILLGATTPVLMSLISREASSHHQGYMLGIAQGTTQFASITGIVLGGWLSQGVGLQYTYFFVATFYAVSVAVILVVQRERSSVGNPRVSSGQ